LAAIRGVSSVDRRGEKTSHRQAAGRRGRILDRMARKAMKEEF
jgi:hypothetical protein